MKATNQPHTSSKSNVVIAIVIGISILAFLVYRISVMESPPEERDSWPVEIKSPLCTEGSTFFTLVVDIRPSRDTVDEEKNINAKEVEALKSGMFDTPSISSELRHLEPELEADGRLAIGGHLYSRSIEFDVPNDAMVVASASCRTGDVALTLLVDGEEKRADDGDSATVGLVVK